MEFNEGYICSYDDIEKMTVDVLEDTMIRMSHDLQLSKEAKREMLRDYLSERKRKLDKQFVFNDESVKQIAEANELIKRKSIESINTAWRMLQDELKAKAADPGNYHDVEINPELWVPFEQDILWKDRLYSSREAEMWSILCSPEGEMDIFPLLSNCDFVTVDGNHGCRFDSAEAAIKEIVCDYDEEYPNWGDIWCLAPEKLKDIIFVRPLHNLCDICKFAVSDALKIKDYTIKIHIEDYDNI